MALVAIHLAATVTAAGFVPTALVLESVDYANSVRAHLQTTWNIVACSTDGANCTSPDPTVRAVIGRADAIDLTTLPALGLVQGASYFHTDERAVPPRAVIAKETGFWPAMGMAQIAEWCIAAIFEHQYRLSQAARTFEACAFAPDAPSDCPFDSTATNHTMVSDLTIGILGYGRIGSRVASMAHAIGATVVATKRNGPFVPPPPNLKWLSSDNDRLYREADVIVVTVPGTGHPETAGMINQTSLALMKEHALILPVSAGPIKFTDLEAALRRRPTLAAVVDTWPAGCWHFPNASCGAPLGERDWPGSPTLASLTNVVPLPGVSMRDAHYWGHSTACAAANLDAFVTGQPLRGVVRNASA